jgi:HAD superfamily hydrolase (TIGR01490 family)
VKPRLTLFDLDHTLLNGDSDVLWCDFLIQHGLLDKTGFGARNEAMASSYRAGTVSPHAFSTFYVATLAGRTAAQWQPWRERFVHEVVAPRIPPAAHRLVQQHQAAGDLVVLSTATNRYLTELTALHLGIEHLIATEPEVDANGQFNGQISGTMNMREGKVQRLVEWLAARGQQLDQLHSRFYSDSINDLPLLAAVNTAIAVDPDEQLRAEAQRRGFAILSLHGA